MVVGLTPTAVLQLAGVEILRDSRFILGGKCSLCLSKPKKFPFEISVVIQLILRNHEILETP